MAKRTGFRTSNFQYAMYGVGLLVLIALISYATITSNLRKNNTAGINRDLKVGNYKVNVADVYFDNNSNVVIDINRDISSLANIENLGKFTVDAKDKENKKELPVDYKNGEEMKKAYIFISGLSDNTRNIQCFFYEDGNLEEKKKADLIIDTKFLEVKDLPKTYDPSEDLKWHENNVKNIKDFVENLDQYEKKLKDDKEQYEIYSKENTKRLENLESLWLKLDEKNNKIESISAQAEMLDEELAPLADQLENIKNSAEEDGEYDIENKDEIWEKVLLREKQNELLQVLEKERDELSTVLEEAKKNTKEVSDYLVILEKEMKEIENYIKEGKEQFLKNNTPQTAMEKAINERNKYAKIYGFSVDDQKITAKIEKSK